ncbi:rhodanese-like domain-containing protein [Candidatus Kaiserbacteria bacterium]|nr:rhodanese-like domain-containing protein [Candidatus Kaiserbacteria bacterium]
MHKTISTEELKKKLDTGEVNFVLVDVLSKEKYAARHVPGAKSIPETPDFVKTFEAALQIPKDTQIALYCTSSTCQASVRAADALEKAGYTNVVHYEDGIAGWQDAGLPLESSN